MSSANTQASIAPRQGVRSSPIRKAVGSVPSGSTARLSLWADLPATPIPFMANPPFATSAGGRLPGVIRAKSLSVISVTYGVVLRMPEHFQNQCLNPVDSSERHELWFRKARTLVPKGTNCGSRRCERFWHENGFPIARTEALSAPPRASVLDSTNFGSR